LATLPYKDKKGGMRMKMIKRKKKKKSWKELEQPLKSLIV
jgi:hypothetical protein